MIGDSYRSLISTSLAWKKWRFGNLKSRVVWTLIFSFDALR